MWRVATAFRFDLSRRFVQLFCMATVTEQQAKAEWSKLLVRARNGEETIVTRDGEPYAKIVPLDAEQTQPTRLG
jgi:prevent-host-death family protein